MIEEYLCGRWNTPDGHAVRVLHVQRQTVTTWRAGAKVTREQAQRWVTVKHIGQDGKVLREWEER